MSGELGVGVIGYGVMGRTHAAAYAEAARAGIACRVRAVFTQADPAVAATGNLAAMSAGPGLEDAIVTDDIDALLADDRIDVVSICTPTDTHVGIALAALAEGKHVLVEKPVALEAASIDQLAASAAAAGRWCLPAMCMRFWPAWTWLYERVRNGSLGAVRAAAFVRVGNPPSWSADFYQDLSRSGGALHDLHVHDVDFLHWCFGVPDAVTSSGSVRHVASLYHFEDGPAPVTAEAGWFAAEGFGFRMGYRILFDEAWAAFDLGATPELRLTHRNETTGIEVGGVSAYEAEVRHFLRVVRGDEAPRVTLHDAAVAARIIATEARSAAAGGARIAVPRGTGMDP
jgi:predicted dehydrogenase